MLAVLQPCILSLPVFVCASRTCVPSLPPYTSRAVNLSLQPAHDPKKKCDPVCLCSPTPCEKSVVAWGPDVEPSYCSSATHTRCIRKRRHRRRSSQRLTAASSDMRVDRGRVHSPVSLSFSTVCCTLPLPSSAPCTWFCTTGHVLMVSLLLQCVTTAAPETYIPTGSWLASLLRIQCECLQQSWVVLSVCIGIHY